MRVQADRREQQRADAEAGDDQGAEALRRRPITLELIDRLYVRDGECRIQRRDDGTRTGRHRHRVLLGPDPDHHAPPLNDEARGLAAHQAPNVRRSHAGAATRRMRAHLVVGVANDVVDGPLGSQPVIHVYVPYTNAPDSLLASPVIDTVREGMTLVAVGLAVGAAGAISATRLLRATLFETNVYDPLTFATVPLVLGVVAFAASYLPARRAAAVDPIVALRD